MKRIVYGVQCSSGCWDEAYDWIQFVTEDLDMAKAWMKKYNHLLSKWKKHWESVYDGNEDKWEDRYIQFSELNYAGLVEIEMR